MTRLSSSESDFFGRDEPIAGLGMAPAVAQRAFDAKQNEVKRRDRHAAGSGVHHRHRHAGRAHAVADEVKARVRDDVVKQKAVEAARQKARRCGALKGGDLAAAAKAAGLEVKTTELIARGAPIADVGVSTAVDAAAFALPAGGVSQPHRHRQRRSGRQGAREESRDAGRNCSGPRRR